MPAKTLLLANIKKQAQNLAKIQNLQLCEAYEIISYAFYHCPNYQDLRKRLAHQHQKYHWFDLASIDSTSNPEALKKLKHVLPLLVDRLSSCVIANTNRLGLSRQIFEIFGIPQPKDSFNSFFQNVETDSYWRPIVNIGSNSHAALESTVTINQISYRLIAISVFMPHHWPFTNHKYSEIAQEISPLTSSDYQLINQDSESLYNLVISYIQKRINSPDDDSIEFELPIQNLSESEKKLEGDIRKILEISGICEWSDEEMQPIPLMFAGSNMACKTYLIFGYPANNTEIATNNKWVMNPEKCPHSGSQILLFNGSPIAIEWISVNPTSLKHNYDFTNHFEDIFSLVSQQSGFQKKFERQKNHSQLIFFRPAKKYEIRSELELRPHPVNGKELWFVKVENSSIAESVIKKICDRELFVSKDKYNKKSLFCKFSDISGETPNLSISLQIISRESNISINLTTSILYSTTNNITTMYVFLSEYFISALDAVGNKKFVKSMKNGLVNKVDYGTFSKIYNIDDEAFDQFSSATDEDAKIIASFESPENFNLDLMSLVNNSRRSEYERDFY